MKNSLKTQPSAKLGHSAPILAVFIAATIALPPLVAEEEKFTFADHVFPILENKCVNCHNTDEAKGGLDLASFSSTLNGGSGGSVVTSEDPSSSRLYTLAAHTEEPIMPPRGTKATDEELRIIARWIDGGLLETKDSKARKSDRPKIDLNSLSSTGKPEGPPAMPEHLILEPSVVTERPNAVPALAHSPWAPIVAVAGQKQILLYHSKDFDLLGVLPYPEGFPQTLSFSPNGAFLFCGGGRAGKSGNVVAWDIKTGERILEAGREFDIVLGADVSPDLKNAIMGGPGRNIKLWDTVAGEQINSVKKHTDWLLTASYSPDGVIYATGDRNGGLYVWEAATGYEFYTLRGHTHAVTDLDWRMDGNVLASCSEDGQVILWEMINGGQVKKWEAHRGGALGIDFAPDGSIATVGRDKTVKIWKGDGTAVRSIEVSDDVVLSVAFSDDSKRVFTGDVHGNIKVWEVESGAELARIDPNPPPIEEQLAYSERRMRELTGEIPKLEEGVKAVSAELAAARGGLSEADKAANAATQSLAAQKDAAAKSDGLVKALAPQVEKAQQDTNAKNSSVKTLEEALASASASLKAQQEEAARLVAEAGKSEGALKTAAEALAVAKTAAANPLVSPEQKSQHEALAAAHAATAKERQSADEKVASKEAELQKNGGELEAAKKSLSSSASALAEAKTKADAAQNALTAASAEKAKADGVLADASKDGQTPPSEVVENQKAATARETAARSSSEAATTTLAAAGDAHGKANGALEQLEARRTGLVAELAASKQEQAAKADALAKAEAAWKPLRDAVAAAAERSKQLQADLAAKTAAHQQSEKARNDLQAAADKANGLVTATQGKITELTGKVATAKSDASSAAAALTARQKEFADARTQLAAAQAEVKKAEELVAATAKRKEDETAKVAAVVKKEEETKKTIALARSELQSTEFLQRKWQAAAINLTASREAENLDDMAIKLEDMLDGESEAKKSVAQAVQARSEAENTLAEAKKTVEDGTVALQEKSASVLERALKLVASRAVAEIREETIQQLPAAESLASSDKVSFAEVSSERRNQEAGVVAAETLAYKTPQEISEEVSNLKDRLSDLEQLLASTYVEATATRSTVEAASQVARETPKLIAERTKAEEEAARELAEAEAERKRQEQALADQTKRIEELRAKYLATLPEREE